MQAFWIPVGFFISIEANDATSHGATLIDAKLVESFKMGDLPPEEAFWRVPVFLACTRFMVGGGEVLLRFLEPSWFMESLTSDSSELLIVS